MELRFFSNKIKQADILTFELSEISDKIVLESVQLEYDKLRKVIIPGNPVSVEILSGHVALKILWNYKNKNPDVTSNASSSLLPLNLHINKRNDSSQKKITLSSSTLTIKNEANLQSQKTVSKHAANISESSTGVSLKTAESKKYFDVIFCTNDSKKVFGHRCILFTFSDIFEAFFNESNDIPIEIEIDFAKSVVTRAIEFCYGKIDRIQGFENGLIEFAEKYSIKGLKKACLKSLMNQILTTENISVFVKIAFEQNYTALKQKCLKFIVKNKAEIGAEKLSKLPIEILVSTILYF